MRIKYKKVKLGQNKIIILLDKEVDKVEDQPDLCLRKDDNKMTNEDFINYLTTLKNKTIIFTLEGIVFSKIQIENINVQYNEDYIEIENSEDKKSYIKLNLHQLMKINKEESKIELEFDQLQKVIITTKEEVS